MLSAETISERSDDRERWKRRVSYIHSELVVPLVSAEWITARTPEGGGRAVGASSALLVSEGDGT